MVYVIYQIEGSQNKKEALTELKTNGLGIYVYFKTPFQHRFIGCSNMKEAKKVYNKILNKNNDLYGCVVSIEGV
jgi:hypothetical protein